jgi:hypothetical protein
MASNEREDGSGAEGGAPPSLVPLHIAAKAYESERRLYRIAYDHGTGTSIVMREDAALGQYTNGGAALYAMEEMRALESMRIALYALAGAEPAPMTYFRAGEAWGNYVKNNPDDTSPRPGKMFRAMWQAALLSTAKGDEQ